MTDRVHNTAASIAALTDKLRGNGPSPEPVEAVPTITVTLEVGSVPNGPQKVDAWGRFSMAGDRGPGESGTVTFGNVGNYHSLLLLVRHVLRKAKAARVKQGAVIMTFSNDVVFAWLVGDEACRDMKLVALVGECQGMMREMGARVTTL